MNRRSFLSLAAAAPLAGAGRETCLSPATPPYRACVIGDTRRGGYGHNLHLMWELAPGIVEVVGLADPDEEGRQRRGAEAKALRTYADYGEMLEREKPDLVSIGPRWTIHHKEYLLACAEVGAHGLMEKPLAVDLAEADVMAQAVDSRRLRWSMAFNFRASPVIDHAIQMVMREGLIGDLLEIRSRGKEDHRAGGEDLIVMGVHVFDLMVTFLGPPRWCAASIWADDGLPAEPSDIREATEPLGPVVGTRLQATYAFRDGIHGYFTSMRNRDGDGGRWGIELYGSKGIVTVRMTEVPEVFWLPEPSWAPGDRDVAWRPLPDAPRLTRGESRVWHYGPIVEDLLDAIDDERQTRVSLADGRMATEMIQAAFESHIQGGRPVPIPLVERDHPLRRWR